MNLLELLEELGIDHRESGQHHHSSPGWIQVCCPFCGEDNFKLGISINWGNCSCWQCGRHRLLDVLVSASGQSTQTVRSLLTSVGWDRNLLTDVRPRGKLVVPEGLGPLLKPHQQYLKGRDFNPGTLEAIWGIQALGMHPRLPWCLFIPITYHGKVVSWTTRTLSDKGKRYHTAKPEEEALPAKNLIYGEDFCRHAIIVVEGPLDVWAIGPGACATLGVSYTEEQLARIAKYPIRAICFDAEVEAQKRAREVLETLSALPGKTTNVVLETGKDASRAEKWEVDQLRRCFLE